jgi:hypothetical protein
MRGRKRNNNKKRSNKKKKGAKKSARFNGKGKQEKRENEDQNSLRNTENITPVEEEKVENDEYELTPDDLYVIRPEYYQNKANFTKTETSFAKEQNLKEEIKQLEKPAKNEEEKFTLNESMSKEEDSFKQDSSDDNRKDNIWENNKDLINSNSLTVTKQASMKLESVSFKPKACKIRSIKSNQVDYNDLKLAKTNSETIENDSVNSLSLKSNSFKPARKMKSKISNLAYKPMSSSFGKIVQHNELKSISQSLNLKSKEFTKMSVEEFWIESQNSSTQNNDIFDDNNDDFNMFESPEKQSMPQTNIIVHETNYNENFISKGKKTKFGSKYLCTEKLYTTDEVFNFSNLLCKNKINNVIERIEAKKHKN